MIVRESNPAMKAELEVITTKIPAAKSPHWKAETGRRDLFFRRPQMPRRSSRCAASPKHSRTSPPSRASTPCKLIFGVHRPSEGTMSFLGAAHAPAGPRDALGVEIVKALMRRSRPAAAWPRKAAAS
ncbi:hypothetical protein PVT71_16890 [Salipiger sp. H15]|uniref:Uncharacterized protein n=1 Tax=Alloyangia sp. H15 TaxID=3029062 RepID=A0AAU8ANS9_9RHOB